MIKELTPESRGNYAKLVDYAKYLLESINGDEIIFLASSFNANDILTMSSRTMFKVSQFSTEEDLLSSLRNRELAKIVLFVESKNISNDLLKIIDTIPFALLITETKVEGFKFNDSNVNCTLSGKFTLLKSVPNKKVLAAVSTFNDEDIIEQVVEYILKQGLDVHVIDNWSSDNTISILEKIKVKYPNRIYISTFPEARTEVFDWKGILRAKANNQINNNYDWIIHYDSDEIRTSPWVGTDLVDAISFVDSLGFNAIDFTVINFELTEDGFTSNGKLEEFFRYFDFGRVAGHRLQIKAWKNEGQKVDLDFHYGHEVLFENKKVFPLNFLLKHYPLRTSEQAYKKIFKERLPRYDKESRETGANNHYDEVTSKLNFLKDPEALINFNNNKDFYNELFIEATSRVGIFTPGKVAIILGFVKEKNENLLIEAIKRINEQSYREFDIYIYDNSEIKDSLLKTRELFPKVYIKKNIKNCGFAGGNNSVMREVLKTNQYEYVALLNDDTQVHVDWLANLVESEKKSEEIGAVTSKLIFYEPYIRLSGKTKTFNPKEIGTGEDTRNLGIKLFLGESRFENTHYTKKFLRDGFYGMEGEYTWSDSQFQLDLPIGIMPLESDYELIFTIEGSEHVTNQSVQVKIDSFVSEIEMEKSKKTYKITVPRDIILKNKFDLIQNASSGISAQFNGYDIGSLNGNAEIDEGQYEEEKEAEMICGGAVLFNANALRKVGIFDEYYFVYYEDSDLSLRIKKEGYKLIYQPKAVVRHIHAGSSSEYSPLFTYHVWKNKPAFVIKNFNIGPSIFALKELALIGFREVKDAVIKHKLRSGYHNSRLKVILKSTIKFYTNLPLILLKKYKIIKSS